MSRQFNLAIIPALPMVRSSLQCIQNASPDLTDEASILVTAPPLAPILTVRVEKLSDAGVLVPLVDIHIDHLPEGMPGFARASTCGASEEGRPVWRTCSLTKTDETTRLDTETTTELRFNGAASLLHVASICTATNPILINPDYNQEDPK